MFNNITQASNLQQQSQPEEVKQASVPNQPIEETKGVDGGGGVTVDPNMLSACECHPPASYKVSNLPEVETPNCSAFYKRIDGQLFIDGCATKYDLRHFNVLSVKDLQIVFVSTF